MNATLDEHWPQQDRDRVETSLSLCPWLAGLPSIQRGTENATNVFGLLLSNKWLTDNTLACMLDVVRSDYAQSREYNPNTCISDPYLGQGIRIGPNGATPTYYGGKLRNRTIERLFFPMNVQNLHWIAVNTDVPSYSVAVGDSYPSVTRPHIKAIIADILRWLRYWVEDSGLNPWTVDLFGIPMSLQHDSSSCGVTAVNAIHRLTVTDAPAWTSGKSCWWRAYYFVRIVELGTTESVVSKLLLKIAIIDTICGIT